MAPNTTEDLENQVPDIGSVGDGSDPTLSTPPEAGGSLVVEGEVNAADLDVLEQDVSDVDTSMPLLKEGLYEVELTQHVVKPNKDGTKTNLALVFGTCNEGRDTEGNVLAKGFPLHHTVSLSPTDKYAKKDIVKAVAKVAQALGVKALDRSAIGKRCLVKIKVQPERADEKTGDTYPPSNKINTFRKI